MKAVCKATKQNPSRLETDDERWQAIVNRELAADGLFFYAVTSTGIYCRNVCPARLALRRNVRFYATCKTAQAAGFRPCKRCRPTEVSLAQRRVAAVTRACRLIENSDEAPSLQELATSAGMSVFHFHRVFKAQTGVTPKAFAAACRTNRVRSELSRSGTVTEAIYRAGFNSNSRFYESSAEVLGMSPKVFRAGGLGMSICFAIGDCSLGSILIAASEKGVCAISLGDDPAELARDLQHRFPNAQLIGVDAEFEQMVAAVIRFVESPSLGIGLPLDIRGTAFQQRVWQALQQIPHGSTASYAEIAKWIGQPKSVRAVAQACAANMLAVAIPCHRVVRTGGSLSGYCWGVERKGQLLRREQESACAAQSS